MLSVKKPGIHTLFTQRISGIMPVSASLKMTMQLKLTQLSRWGILAGNSYTIEAVSETDKKWTVSEPLPAQAPVSEQPAHGPLPVKFIHEKGPQYRIYHADAAWGTANGQSNIQLEFYLEHPPIPTVVIQPVKPDGTFTGEQKLEPIQDAEHFVVIRDFQVGIVLSLQSALQVQAVLGSFIELVKEQQRLSMETKK
jgi:hypothetical protein